ANALHRERVRKREQAWRDHEAALERLDSAVRQVESRRRRSVVASAVAGTAGVLHLLLGLLAARDI
ncbi:MAG TPA: hypothetical protein VMK65_09830, partial [Longimicrobiales bacterium]|nr:hypothetical protein [Longimicrobiales bacterium]